MTDQNTRHSILRILGALSLGLASLLPIRPSIVRAQVSAITEQYLDAAYGVHVEDNGGTARLPSKAWTDHELSLLNDVFEALPPTVLHKMSRVRILRSASDLNPQRTPEPSQFGVYLDCDLDYAPDCSGLASSIYIFDHAHFPFDFPGDAQGDLEFKGTVLHELTHALQNFPSETADSAWSGDEGQSYHSETLLRAWIAATRSWTPGDGLPYCADPTGWVQVGGKWKVEAVPGNEPPTSYAATEPAEDMAESVMLYVYDPQRLKNSSAERYDFIRDNIFDGREYLAPSSCLP